MQITTRSKVIIGFAVATFMLVRLGGHGEVRRPPLPTGSPTGSPIVYQNNRTMLVYNRLPKTRSETFMKYFQFCRSVGHQEFGLKQPMVTYFDINVAAAQVAVEARKLLRRYNGNVVLTGHFLWTNLNFLKEEFPGLTIEWINLMREPTARLVSNYNYMRWGRRTDGMKRNYIARLGDLSIENCTKTPECMFELAFEGNRQTALLMGGWHKRFDLEWLHNHYSCMGIMENRSSFVDCFTKKFPALFENFPFNMTNRINQGPPREPQLSQHTVDTLEAFTYVDRIAYNAVKNNLNLFS
jgi:hypothetical protein